MEETPPSRGGRNYVAKTPDPRLRPALVDVFLLGSSISHLSSNGRLPLRGAALCYLVGRMNRQPKCQKIDTHILCPLISGTTIGKCDTSDGCVAAGDPCVVAEVKRDSWIKSKLPMKGDRAISQIILADYKELQTLKKNKSRKTVKVMEDRQKFKDKMETTLDAAKSDAEDIIRKDRLRTTDAVREDIAFLKDQLEGNRRMQLGMVDTEHSRAVENKNRRDSEVAERKKKSKQDSQNIEEIMETKSDTEDVSSSDEKEDNYSQSVVNKKKKLDEDFVTVKLPRKLLQGETVVTGKRFHVGNQALTSIVGSLVSQARDVDTGEKVDLNKFIMSTSTTRRDVGKAMTEKAEDSKRQFKNKLKDTGRTLFLLFDGKSVEETSKRMKQARPRLAVMVDSPDLEEPQVLGVPVLKSSSGEDQVEAIWPLLEEWEVLDHLAGVSFDTTAENTGWQKGVNSRLQQKLGRDLLWRACRRHSQGRHMMKAAIVVMGDTKGASWSIFKTVCKGWADFVEDDLHSGIDYDNLDYYEWGKDKVLDKRAAEVLAWGLDMLARGKFERGDYKQLLILTVVWLGGKEMVENFRFAMPGAHHFARYI